MLLRFWLAGKSAGFLNLWFLYQGSTGCFLTADSENPQIVFGYGYEFDVGGCFSEVKAYSPW